MSYVIRGDLPRIWNHLVRSTRSRNMATYRECPSCALNAPAGTTECPFCGYEFPSSEPGSFTVAWLMIGLMILFGIPILAWLMGWLG